MKRRISFILALLILAGSMSCGSDSGDKTQDTTAGDTTTSGETTAEEVLTDGVPELSLFSVCPSGVQTALRRQHTQTQNFAL